MSLRFPHTAFWSGGGFSGRGAWLLSHIPKIWDAERKGGEREARGRGETSFSSRTKAVCFRIVRGGALIFFEIAE